MTIKKLLEYLKLKTIRFLLGNRMVEVNETMALKEVSETYAKYVCKMHGWAPRWFGDYTDIFCAISFALMDGYIKAMHDNGYEFQNGLVKKRDIMNEMPCGALDYYRKDAIVDTKAKAVEALKQVMEKYETSKQNINVIVNDFEKEINKEE